MNSHRIPYAGILVTLFGAAQILLLVSLLALPFSGGLAQTRYVTTTVKLDHRFSWPSQNFHSDAASVEFSGLYAQLKVTGDQFDPPEVRSLVRRAAIANMAIEYLAMFAISHLLWRFCRNIQKAQVFTPRNLDLVRLIGATLVIVAIIQPIVRYWTDQQVADYVGQHASLGDTPVAAFINRSWISFFAGINIGEFVTGLVMLLIAQVFRQGLRLKQEVDLTV